MSCDTVMTSRKLVVSKMKPHIFAFLSEVCNVCVWFVGCE